MTDPRRALLADRCHDRANTLRALLSAWRYEVAVAPGGPAALAVASDFRPDVALIDLDLADLSGHTVARRLRRWRALDGVLLIAITNDASGLSLVRCNAAGFDYRLVTPFDPEELRGFVRGAAVASPWA